MSLILNFGDLWAAGRSPATCGLVPRLSVVGPVTGARLLHVGRRVSAVGAASSSTFTAEVFGIPASELLDRIVPLEDLWPRGDVETLLPSGSHLDLRLAVSTLRDSLVARVARTHRPPTLERAAPALIRRGRGCTPVDEIARSYGLSRRQFARRFSAATGFAPKMFARLTRFQALVHTLLSTDTSQWAGVSSDVGFYDQAHMINEFRTFAGAPPTVFFRPHEGVAAKI